MRRYIAGGIAVLILTGVSMVGYTYFNSTPDVAEEPNDHNTSRDGTNDDLSTRPAVNLTRELPYAAEPGDTIKVALTARSDEPMNTTLYERIDLNEETYWRNITVSNLNDERYVYELELPDTGNATFSISISNASVEEYGDESIQVSGTDSSQPRAEPYYNPSSVGELFPRNVGNFSRTGFDTEDSSSQDIVQLATANYEREGDSYEVEVREHTSSQKAWDSLSSEIKSVPENDREWTQLYETRLYNLDGIFTWKKGPFVYTVSGPEQQELARSLLEVHYS